MALGGQGRSQGESGRLLGLGRASEVGQTDVVRHGEYRAGKLPESGDGLDRRQAVKEGSWQSFLVLNCSVLLTTRIQLLSVSLVYSCFFYDFFSCLKYVFSGVGSSLGHLAFCFHAVHSSLSLFMQGCLSI